MIIIDSIIQNIVFRIASQLIVINVLLKKVNRRSGCVVFSKSFEIHFLEMKTFFML